MEIRTYRKLSGSDLRKCCIENGYYTWGSLDDYDLLLSYADKHTITDEVVKKIAVDIYEHSDYPQITSQFYTLSKEQYLEYRNTISHIAFTVLLYARTFCEVVD